MLLKSISNLVTMNSASLDTIEPVPEAIAVYLQEENKFCGICLVTTNEARLTPNMDLYFFETIEFVTRISPWLCVWCWGSLRSLRVLREKAVCSQQLLSEISSSCLNKDTIKALIERLDEVKRSRYTTHVGEVMNMSILPDVPIPVQCCVVKQEPLELEASKDTWEPVMPTSGGYFDLEDKEERKKPVNVIEIEIKQDCNAEDADPCASDITMFSKVEGKGTANKPLKCRPRRKKEPTNVTQSLFKIFSSDPLPHILKCVEMTEDEMLRDHSDTLMKAGYLKAALKCANCALKFESTESFDKHMKLHSPVLSMFSRDRECDIDIERRASAGNRVNGAMNSVMKSPPHYPYVGAHYRRTMVRGALRCRVCGRHDSVTEQHERHVRAHYRRVGCRLCDYTSRSRRLVVTHYISAHTRGQFQCLYCDRNYTEKPTKLEKHVEKEHGIRLIYKCNICRLAFWVPDLLATHKRSHKKRTPPGAVAVAAGAGTPHVRHDRYCSICRKELKDHFQLTLHNNRSHNEDAWKLECDDCGKKFFSKYDLTIHIRGLHMNNGPKCPHCPKRFLTKTRREKHIECVHLKIRHAKDKICEICGRGFSKHHQLRDHRLVHTGERPHACATCDRRFALASSLAKHVNHVHRRLERRQRKRPSRGSGFLYPRNDAGDIYCAQCDKTFQYKLAYSNHYKAHQRKNDA